LIPYFELRELEVGGISLSVFGTLVALGVAAGVVYAERRAAALGVSQRGLYAAIASALVPGFLLAHAVALLPHLSELRLADVFAFWNGMSSFGGFAGAGLGLAILYARSRRSWLREADLLLQALVVGWVFGRLACTLVHDHVGRPSDFVLAIGFPGGARHDLGFYELLYTVLVLVPALVWLGRRRRAPGATVAVISLLYAPARFLGDFLRQTDLPGADARYAGLTLAQYACLALAGLGLYYARRVRAEATGG
jgi:phosphatidylglycerol:prolipoprotein diacylglycerol transferase